MFNLLTLIVCATSQMLYYNDPGNDLTKPRTLAKIREGDTSIDFYFEFSNDQKEVTMMIEIDKVSYFSLGLGKSMEDADLWVFEIKDAVIVATDSHCVKHGKPPTDESSGGTNDIEILGYYYDKDGKSAVKFKRKADTGDEFDKKLVQGKQVDFIWAHGKTETDITVSNHGKLFRGTVAIDLEDDGGSSDVEIEDSVDYYHLHKWGNFISWGIASDVAIMSGRYLKTWGYRTYLHGFLFVLIVSTSLVTAVLMLVQNDGVLKWKNFSKESIKNEIHIIFFFILAICMVAQCIGGFIYNSLLTSLKKNKQVSIKPSYHQIFGSIVYIVGKLQILAGLFMDNDVRLMLILGAVITTRFVMEVLYQKDKLCVLGSTTKRKNKVYGKDALLQLNDSEFDNFDEKKLWCIYRNQVVDLSSMIHPGGNYIWKQVVGQDITKYVLGGYSIDNLKNYKHTSYALKALLQHQTGILVQDYLELFYQNGSPLRQVKAVWTLKQIKPYSESTVYFGFENEQFQIKNTYTGLQTLGQYFIIKSNDFDEISTRQYTMVMSMTEERIQYRRDVLELFKKVLALQPIHKEVPKLQEYTKQLPLIIKKYDSPKGFSKHIHEDNRNGQYIIQGPFGTPINIEGHIVIIAGGTGLLPFLDLLDYQLRMSYYLLMKKSLGVEAAQLIDLGLPEKREFKITLLVAVASQDELIGKDIIMALISLQQKLDVPNFRLIVKGNFKMKDVEVISQRFTEDVIRKYAGDLNAISNFLVCGPPQMNQTIEQLLKRIGKVTVL